MSTQHVKLLQETKKKIQRRVAYELELQRPAMAQKLGSIARIAAGVAALDVLGAKQENLQNFLQKFNLQFDCLVAKTVGVDNLKQILSDEGGIDVETL